jgi:predicted kinase
VTHFTNTNNPVNFPKMKTAYILVGVPGSGKSTWIENQKSWAQDCAIISTDYHVEEYARSVGKTYSEVFEEYMPTAVRLMADNVVTARNYDFNIIWDQTSTTVASRAKKFRMLPDYQHIAVVFRTPSAGELQRRAHRPMQSARGRALLVRRGLRGASRRSEHASLVGCSRGQGDVGSPPAAGISNP